MDWVDKRHIPGTFAMDSYFATTGPRDENPLAFRVPIPIMTIGMEIG